MSGAVRAEVILSVDRPQERQAFNVWLERWRHRVGRLKNTGCGCCVDIFEFSLSEKMFAELKEALLAVGISPNRLG